MIATSQANKGANASLKTESNSDAHCATAVEGRLLIGT